MQAFVQHLPIKETVVTAWEKVKGSKSAIWIAMSLTFVIMFCVGVVTKVTGSFSENLGGIAYVLQQVINYLFQMGLLYIGIQRARDMPISYRLMFYAFETRLAINVIGLYLLEIILFIPIIALFVMGRMFFNPEYPLNMLLGVLFYGAAIVAFLYLAVRLSIAIAMVLDKNANPLQAVKMSYQATRENFWRLLALFGIQIVAIFVGLATLGIGLIWALPFCYIVYGLIYKNLVVNIKN